MSLKVVLFRIPRMSARLNRAEVFVTGAQILQRRKALGSTWMADSSTKSLCFAKNHRPEHSDCVGIEPQRKNALGIFSDVAGANRPEVVVTAGQNVAKVYCSEFLG